jgi:hypothetical protein
VLVVPWSEHPAPAGLEQKLFRPEHMETLKHPGVAVWFNMDASDEVLRENFEKVLRHARKHWPFVGPGRGLHAANPRITKDIFRKWYDWKIVQLFDLDYHFAAKGEKAPTPDELATWIYGTTVDAKKISEARAMMRDVMSRYLPALRHTMRLNPIHHVDGKFGELPRSSSEISHAYSEVPRGILSTDTSVDVDKIVEKALARECAAAHQPSLGSRTDAKSARSRPIDLSELDLSDLDWSSASENQG